MIKRLSFLSHPFMTILEHSEEVVPGMEKMVGIFYSEKEGRVVAFESSKSGEVQELDISGTLSRISEERNAPEILFWTNPNEVPFAVKDRERRIQMKLDYEFEDNVLLLRFPRLSDSKSDLLIIYFKRNLGPFKLTAAKDPVNMMHKSIIEKVVYNSILFFAQNEAGNKSIFEKLIAADRGKSKQDQSLKDNYRKSIRSIAEFFIERISKRSEWTFRLTEEALNRISVFDGKLELLEPILEDAITVALNRIGADATGTVLIKEEDIVITPKTAIGRVEPELQQDRYGATIAYLDRYENAIKKLLEGGQKITGANIGNVCSPPISAAAISDNLKKHEKKIVSLLNKYPEKWSLLRAKFRPVGKLVVLNQKHSSVENQTKDIV